jgi:hypothetical protein
VEEPATRMQEDRAPGCKGGDSGDRSGRWLGVVCTSESGWAQGRVGRARSG